MKQSQSHHQVDRTAAAHHLYQAIATLKNAEEVQHFFQDLCTPAELEAMTDRWRVVPFLKQGLPYWQIYDETGVSMTTIGRVARCLTLGTGAYELIYRRVEKKYDEKQTTLKNRNPKKRQTE